jgi:transposase
MEILFARCCGLDVHKRTVVACLLTPGVEGQPTKEIRTFGTMTNDLLALSDWLAAAGCTHVAMEATGAYWKPIYNLLEDHFAVVVVNAAHIKAVPGRKTDVRDAEWIADLLRHGLLRASFIPDRPHRELRELTRYRTTLVHERANEVNRLQKVLEGANIKLASVATDILGKSGRDMLETLVAGTADATALAQLARGRLREKIPQLEQALSGQFSAHQRFLIAEQLAHIDFLDASLERVSTEIGARLRPFEPEQERLQSIPGVGRRTVEVLLAEIGADLRRFPSARHLASWAGLCPACVRHVSGQR